MKIGFVDADYIHRRKITFPNLALMKLSAWHKSLGDDVEWYEPLVSGHLDKVYVSKVFSNEYTPDIQFVPDADDVVYGGSGYAIKLTEGREVYDKSKDLDLPCHIEHIMPDYSLYGITDTAYGFLTKGCPRGCDFCHVAGMQGKKVYDASPISEFWNGQDNIVLLDPNITASPRCLDHFVELADTNAFVDFSQGLDIRLMTAEKWDALKRIKVKKVHFAWDNPHDDICRMLEEATHHIKVNRSKHAVYVLTNFNSTFEEDVYRVETIKEYGFAPYVMIYDKPNASHDLIRLQRYANNRYVCNACPTFADYNRR